MKTITFTVLPQNGALVVKSKNLLVEAEDKAFDVSCDRLVWYMQYLTSKYNEMGYSVLFEVE